MRVEQIEEGAAQPPEPEGQDSDAIRWDGSEAEMVADEEVKEYHDSHTAVKVSYTLTDDEVRHALEHLGLSGQRRVVLDVLVAVTFVVALVHFLFFSDHNTAVGAVLSGCVVLGAALLVYSRVSVRRQAMRVSDHQEYTLKFYPDHIKGEHGGKKFNIPLNGTVPCDFYDGMVMLRFGQEYVGRSEHGLLLLPLRSVEPAMLADVEAVLRAGTTPWLSRS